jgi:hypothetical protein
MRIERNNDKIKIILKTLLGTIKGKLVETSKFDVLCALRALRIIKLLQ